MDVQKNHQAQNRIQIETHQVQSKIQIETSLPYLDSSTKDDSRAHYLISPPSSASPALKRIRSPTPSDDQSSLFATPYRDKRLRLSINSSPIASPLESKLHAYDLKFPNYPSDLGDRKLFGLDSRGDINEVSKNAESCRVALDFEQEKSKTLPLADTKTRAFDMIHWALSSNVYLKEHYEATNILGWGGCGAVFEARRLIDGVLVMYKTSKRSGTPLEIDILAKVKCSSIVAHHGHFEDNRAYYLVMERFGKIWKPARNLEPDEIFEVQSPKSIMRPFTVPTLKILSGTSSSLFDFIDYNKSGKVPSRSQKPLFKQIALAIKYLHENGIVHGDVKEENILIGSVKGRLVAKLCDFGHSVRVSRTSPKMKLYGTKVLTSPELLCHLRSVEKGETCQDPAQLGFKQDVWALGIVFWTMLHGAMPVENDRYIQGEFDMDSHSVYPTSYSTIGNSGITSLIVDALDLMRKMLCVDPVARISATQILNHPYFAK